jgi:site-specific DNA-methyltransferase (adenine-specific)
VNSVHFSTGKDDWGTPQDLFDALNKEFNFTLDPCADDKNHKCDKYYTIEQDGLAQSWAGETVFCNPPYSRKTKTNAGQIAWVEKCYKEATEGGEHRGYADTCPHRHNNVSRLHFRKSRDTIYQRAC